MAECPYCKIELEEIQSVDFEVNDAGIFWDYTGECPKCKKNFQWSEHYSYNGVLCLEEIGTEEGS